MEDQVKSFEEAIENLNLSIKSNTLTLESLKSDVQKLNMRLDVLTKKTSENSKYTKDQETTIGLISEHLRTHDEHLGLVNRNLELHHQYLALLNEKIAK